MICAPDLARLEALLAAEADHQGLPARCAGCKVRILRPDLAIRVPHLRAVARSVAVVDLLASCGERCAAKVRADVAAQEARLASTSPTDRGARALEAVASALARREREAAPEPAAPPPQPPKVEVLRDLARAARAAKTPAEIEELGSAWLAAHGEGARL